MLERIHKFPLKVKKYILSKILDNICNRLRRGKYKSGKEKQHLQLKRLKYGLEIGLLETRIEKIQSYY